MAINDATPHLERMAEQLNEIRKHLATIEHTHNFVDQLVTGVEALRRQSELQTETAAEMTIVTVLAELAALEKLLDEESQQTRKLIENGERELAMHKEVFDRSIGDVGADRNRRVAKLLEPVFAIIDHDADEHIDAHYPPVFKHLGAFGATIVEQIKEREDTIRGRLDRVVAVVKDYAESREKMLGGIRTIKHEAPEGNSPESLSIPFYVVHRRNKKSGELRADLIAPSTVERREGTFEGYAYEPIPNFESYVDRLGSHLPPPPEPNTTIGGGDMLNEAMFDGGVFVRSAAKIMSRLVSQRKISLASDCPAAEGDCDGQ